MQIQNGIEETSELHHLYVHVPFCPKICPYCSFYKEASDRNKTQSFLDAVLLDLDRRLQTISSCRIETIFFGGGTPSALSMKQLEFLLSGLHRRLDLSGLREWTLEMNPATVSYFAILSGWRAFGAVLDGISRFANGESNLLLSAYLVSP